MKKCEQRAMVKLEYRTNTEALNNDFDNRSAETVPLNQMTYKNFNIKDYPGQQKGKRFSNGPEFT